MKFPRKSVSVVAALACAGLAAGCGGTSKAEYQKEVKAIGKEVNDDFDKLSSGQPTAKDLGNAEESLNDAADKLDDVAAPSEVESLHEDLVETLHDAGDLMGKMSPLMEQAKQDPAKVDQEELQKVSNDLSKVGERMEKISEGYKKKGYKLDLENS